MAMLKLFVVGESSPNSREWNASLDRSIVVARDAKEALALSGFNDGEPVTEIPLDQSRVVVHYESPWED